LKIAPRWAIADAKNRLHSEWLAGGFPGRGGGSAVVENPVHLDIDLDDLPPKYRIVTVEVPDAGIESLAALRRQMAGPAPPAGQQCKARGQLSNAEQNRRTAYRYQQAPCRQTC